MGGAPAAVKKRPWGLVVAVGIIPGGASVGIFALPVWPLALIVGALVANALARAHGWAWAMTATIISGTVNLYAVAMVSAWMGANLHAAMAVALAAIGLAAGSNLVRHGVHVPSGRSLAWTGAMPAVWLLAAAIGAVIPGGSARDWAMRGDSSNNVLFARDVITDHGTAIEGANPVPLPHLAIALGMTGEGRPGLAADLTSYVWVWHLLIVVTLLAAGLLGRAVAARLGVTSRTVVGLATVLPALCAMSWAVTGHAIEFGFINAHLGVLLVVLSLLVALTSPSATWGMAMQVLTAVALLVTWGPLALVPVVMSVAHVVAALGKRPSRREGWILAGAMSVGLAYVAATLLIHGSAVRTALTASGGVLAPSPRTLIIALGTLTAAVALLSLRSRAVGAWTMLVALALTASIAGTWILAGQQWTYYPMKMAWFAAVVAALVLAALGVPGARLVGPRAARFATALVVGGALAVTAGVPVVKAVISRPSWVVEPLSQMVAPSSDRADILFGIVTALDTPGDEIRLLWSSGVSVEREANFWILNDASGRFAETADPDRRLALRQVAYAQLGQDDAQLCGLETVAGTSVTVVTADTALDQRVREFCGEEAPTIQLVEAADPILTARILESQ